MRFVDDGSCDRNNTPTFSLAMPPLGTAGQFAAFAVPSGTRPNIDASYIMPPRSIVTALSSGQLFARNTPKQGGAIDG